MPPTTLMHRPLVSTSYLHIWLDDNITPRHIKKPKTLFMLPDMTESTIISLTLGHDQAINLKSATLKAVGWLPTPITAISTPLLWVPEPSAS